MHAMLCYDKTGLLIIRTRNQTVHAQGKLTVQLQIEPKSPCIFKNIISAIANLDVRSLPEMER